MAFVEETTQLLMKEEETYRLCIQGVSVPMRWERLLFIKFQWMFSSSLD